MTIDLERQLAWELHCMTSDSCTVSPEAQQEARAILAQGNQAVARKRVELTRKRMGLLSDLDRRQIDSGYEHGNYAAAYETEDFEKACNQLCGATGFYRVGFLLGFFSSYEVSEIRNPQDADDVARFRAALDIDND